MTWEDAFWRFCVFPSQKDLEDDLSRVFSWGSIMFYSKREWHYWVFVALKIRFEHVCSFQSYSNVLITLLRFVNLLVEQVLKLFSYHKTWNDKIEFFSLCLDVDFSQKFLNRITFLVRLIIIISSIKQFGGKMIFDASQTPGISFRSVMNGVIYIHRGELVHT